MSPRSTSPLPWRGRGVGIAFLPLALALAGCVAGYDPPPGPFPNLNQAEGNLQAAVASLRAAPPIFGGHKAEAVRLIEAAINEIEMAKYSAR